MAFDSLCFRPLGSVLRATLLAASDPHRVQSAADDVIAHSREILNPATANQHDRVLLQIVADAGNVGCNLNSIGQSDAGNFTQGGVRLLRSLRIDAGANPTFLRTSLQSGAGRLVPWPLATGTNQLIKSRPALFRCSLSRAR